MYFVTLNRDFTGMWLQPLPKQVLRLLVWQSAACTVVVVTQLTVTVKTVDVFLQIALDVVTVHFILLFPPTLVASVLYTTQGSEIVPQFTIPGSSSSYIYIFEINGHNWKIFLIADQSVSQRILKSSAVISKRFYSG